MLEEISNVLKEDIRYSESRYTESREEVMSIARGIGDEDDPGIAYRGAPDVADSESDAIELYNYLIHKMGVSKDQALALVKDAIGMMPRARAIASESNMSECPMGDALDAMSQSQSSVSLKGQGRMLDYGENMSDAGEGSYARKQLNVIQMLTSELQQNLHDEDDLPEWVQIYLVQSEMLMQKVAKHLLPAMAGYESKVAQSAPEPQENVTIVTSETFTPMKSRAHASVRKSVKTSRRTGKFSSMSLADILDTEND
jgi:hypothetical protein